LINKHGNHEARHVSAINGGENKKYIYTYFGSVFIKGKISLKRKGADGRIILKSILDKVSGWTGPKWLRMEFN
jgi:hypothetical protein